uniref:Helix-turn-helix domain-containing protein n=1 Tax=Streptomyces sp. NBC_00093 TaxID=2975649 RepID=A0AAU2A230_9ACTN
MESQMIRPGHLTAHQTARTLGISLDGVRKLVQRGHLTHTGGSPRQPWYAAEDVTALVIERRTHNAA